MVLPLSVLDHGDEPHDNVETEARSRSPATSIPSIPSQGRSSDFRANRRSIHSGEVGLLTARRLKANWLAAPRELLDRGGVADECGRHLQALGRDVAHARLHIVRDPLHEVGRVLVLHIQHLLVHLLGAHLPTEHG